jgi:hypothetical protein
MFKVDDTFPESRKVDKLGEKYPKLYSKCIALWLFVGCYSARNRTDGVVSLVRIRSLNPFLGINSRHINALIDVGLWVKTDDVIEMKNWSEYNETKAEKDERLRRDRERKKRDRDKGKEGVVHADVRTDVQVDSERTSERNPGIGTGIGIGFKDKGNSNSPKEWMQIAKMHTEITGSVQDTYSQKEAAEIVLEACKRVNGSDYLKIARAALTAYWADEWVKENRPGLKYLAKYPDKFIRKPERPKRKQWEQYDEIKNKERLQRLQKHTYPKIVEAIKTAQRDGNAEQVAHHQGNLDRCLDEIEGLGGNVQEYQV